MKILFIHPPWSEVYGNYKSASKVGNAYPPLGVCYLSAVAEADGHETRIIDAEMEDKDIAQVVAEALAYAPDLIGVTATTSIVHIAKNLASELKARLPGVPIVLGGPHATAVQGAALESESPFDYLLYGEAENCFTEFLALVQGRREPDQVAGLVYRDPAGAVWTNAAAPLEEELDGLPFPARQRLDLDRYRWSVPGKGIVRFTTIMTSRGCPFRCIFCSAHTVFGRRVRYRKIERVLDELEHCVNDLDIRHFSFIDDTLTLKHDRVRQLCAGIRERGLDITWEGWTRANTVDYDILKVMRDAGFVRVSFGIESAHPEVAKLVRKGVPLDAYPAAYAAAKKLGIETRGSIILGMPGETRSSALTTIRFARDLKDCDQLYINIATPYPATELYAMAQQGLHGLTLLTDDFSAYRRYGQSVLAVNDLTAQDLVRLQRLGFLAFYLTPGRIWYNFRRAGLTAFLKNALAFTKSVILR